MIATRRLGLVLLALGTVVGASACEGLVSSELDAARAAASQPALPRDPLLDAAADAKAAEMCDAGAASPTLVPGDRYDAESARAVDELVGSAPYDAGVVDDAARLGGPTLEVWGSWSADATVVDPRWDDVGIGEAECADGNLYLAMVLREQPSMPSSGRYSTPIFTSNQVQQVAAVQYGSAMNASGQHQALLMDVFLPPASDTVAARPLVILVHGGGFSGGSRADLAGSAREYARRGFVAASIDYRLQANSTLPEQLAAASNAIDDSRESVRFLRANAATYGIDTSRIAMAGSSAGGAIALGVGTWADPTPGGPLAAWSPAIDAAVSTGAHLTPGLGIIDVDAGDAPALMFHYETDTVTGNTDEYAFETCAALRDAGSTCDFVVQTGSGHTVSISASGSQWTPDIGPFLWTHLRLS